jgi:hypothetical protein
MSCLRSSPGIGREHPGGERVAGNAISPLDLLKPVQLLAGCLSERVLEDPTRGARSPRWRVIRISAAAADSTG